LNPYNTKPYKSVEQIMIVDDEVDVDIFGTEDEISETSIALFKLENDYGELVEAVFCALMCGLTKDALEVEGVTDVNSNPNLWKELAESRLENVCGDSERTRIFIDAIRKATE